MNYTKAVFLINKKVRAIQTRYETPEEVAGGKRNGQSVFGGSFNEFRTFKTLDATIKKDDLVVVPTEIRYKMTVVKVVEVDVDIDFDSTENVDWIIDKVDSTGYEKLLTDEDQAVRVIKSAEKRKKQEDLREALFKDSMGELKELPIAYINGDSSGSGSGSPN